MRINKDKRGFSLVELLIAMVVFGILMLLTSQAFKVVLTQNKKLFKAAESNIEGVVGLEMLRKDVAQAGYGLPWTVQSPYSSVKGAGLVTLPVSNDDIKTANDDSTSSGIKAPRPIWSLDNFGYNGSDYLVVKSTVVAMNDTVKKSGILRQDGLTVADPSMKFTSNEAVTVVKPTFSPDGSVSDRLLITRNYFKNVSSASSPFWPKNAEDTYLVYGLDNNKARAPFNRADYYIYRPTTGKAIPEVCAKVIDSGSQAVKGIGILYKAVMNQGNGYFTQYPLLDCVADMQVVYGLDSDENTTPGTVYSHADTLGSSSPMAIRAYLKEVRIYILAQEGQKDSSYTYPKSKILVGESFVGGTYGRQFDFAVSNIKDWQNYHWKLYTIVVQPPSL